MDNKHVGLFNAYECVQMLLSNSDLVPVVPFSERLAFGRVLLDCDVHAVREGEWSWVYDR